MSGKYHDFSRKNLTFLWVNSIILYSITEADSLKLLAASLDNVAMSVSPGSLQKHRDTDKTSQLYNSIYNSIIIIIYKYINLQI